MSNKITGLVKDVGQFLVGEVIKEDDNVIVLKNVSMLAISANGPQVNIQFVPLDLLSLQPPIGIKNLVKDPSIEFEITYKKENLLFYGLELSDTVISNYKSFSDNKNASLPPNLINTSNISQSPDENIVKLFD